MTPRKDSEERSRIPIILAGVGRASDEEPGGAHDGDPGPIVI